MSFTKVNIHDAKSSLSKLVAQVEEGGDAIALCRAGKPIAQITALPAAAKISAPKKLTTGLLKGQIWISPDFDKASPTESALFGIAGGV